MNAYPYPMIQKHFKHYCQRAVGLCPYHKETVGSCCVELTMGTFYCHGCRKKGTMEELETKLLEVHYGKPNEQLAQSIH